MGNITKPEYLKSKEITNLEKQINERTTMTKRNCLFLTTSDNPRGFSVSCVIEKFSDKPRNYK